MTSLLNLILLVALPLQIQNKPTGQDPALTIYCNERFQFCSHFPEETFPTQTDFNDGDGLLMQTENGLATVTIAGYSDHRGGSTKEVYQRSVQQLAGPGEKTTLVSSLFGEDFYECFFLIDKRSFYHKTYLFDGYFVRLSIETTVNQPLLLRELQQAISLDFQQEDMLLGEKLGSMD